MSPKDNQNHVWIILFNECVTWFEEIHHKNEKVLCQKNMNPKVSHGRHSVILRHYSSTHKYYSSWCCWFGLSFKKGMRWLLLTADACEAKMASRQWYFLFSSPSVILFAKNFINSHRNLYHQEEEWKWIWMACREFLIHNEMKLRYEIFVAHLNSVEWGIFWDKNY